MKSYLKFDLPEEKEEFEAAIRASDLCLCLWDISQKLRENIKYNDNLTEEQYNIYCKIQDDFYEILEEHDINLDRLMS